MNNRHIYNIQNIYYKKKANMFLYYKNVNPPGVVNITKDLIQKSKI